MQVTAAADLRCPMENNPHQYINDKDAETVPDSAYYRRLVDDGSLVLSPPAKQRREKPDFD